MRGLRRGDTAPSYRQAFKKRRCLIPVDGFYEWKKVFGENIPYSVSIKDDSPPDCGKAGKILLPTNGCAPVQSSRESRMSLCGEIHTRMPVVLPEEHHEAWLSGKAGKEVLEAV